MKQKFEKGTSKNIIAIDASSSAIGYSIWKDGVLLYSNSVHVKNSHKKDVTERVTEIEKKFLIDFKYNASKKVLEKTGLEIHKVVDTLVLNLGYVPVNGVEESVIGLSDVQSFLRHLFFYSEKYSLKYAPVLDSSWVGVLRTFIDFKGTHKELNRRSIKKYMTVKAALKVIGFDYKKVDHMTGPFFIGEKYDGTTREMSDDEADAIFSGYAYMFLDIEDTTLLSKKEKNIRLREDSKRSEIGKVDRKIISVENKIVATKSELDHFSKKVADNNNVRKTDINSLDLRKEKMLVLQQDLIDLKIKKEKLKKEYKEIRGIKDERS